jgi:hypothetical protein
MRQIRQRVFDHSIGIRTRTLAVATAAVALLATLGVASPAVAGLRHELQNFSDCPYNTPKLLKCVYSTTTSGEFTIGKGNVPIVNPVLIQAGLLQGGVVVPATDGNTLSKTPEPVPGGLVGINLLGNFTEVNAIAEIAGPVIVTNEVTLPAKVRLENPLLGGACYIGSNSEPLTLQLTYGKTSPPPPNVSISGEEAITNRAHEKVIVITGKLVGNAFSAPGANGCTLLPLVGDLAVNTKEGLPSAAGTNTAIMKGVTEEVSSGIVKNTLPLPDIGRCVKTEGKPEGKTLVYSGEFTNTGCTEIDVEQHSKYEWVPGPGPKAKFALAGKGLTLAAVGGTTVKCSGASSTGEYTGAKTQSLALTLTGCKLGKVLCHSGTAAEGEVVTTALTGSLDFINEELGQVGVDLKPTSGSTIAAFECGGKASSVGGSVIVPISATGKMLKAFKLKASATAGKQAPEAFEEGPSHVLSLDGEQAGLTGSLTASNEESYEVRVAY